MPWLPGHLHRWDQQKPNTICATDWTESSDKKCCVLDNHITAWTPFTDETSNWLVSFLVFWMGLWSPIYWCDTNERTLKNTHNTKQKWTNYGFFATPRNTHPGACITTDYYEWPYFKIRFTNLEQMLLKHSQELLAPWKRLTVYWWTQAKVTAMEWPENRFYCQWTTVKLWQKVEQNAPITSVLIARGPLIIDKSGQ